MIRSDPLAAARRPPRRLDAPIIALRLHDGGMRAVTLAGDGFLYAVDGGSGCADAVDVGESTHAAVLADDVDSNGSLDLLVTTLSGLVYCFETGTGFDALKTWPALPNGPHGLFARHDYFGIFADGAWRAPHDVAGESTSIKVHVVDKRPLAAANGTVLRYGHSGPYRISAVLKDVVIWEMNMGSQPVMGGSHTLDTPGSFVFTIPTPHSRTTATVVLTVSDAAGFSASDEFVMSFHMHYYKLLKWLLALPMVASAALTLAVLSGNRVGSLGLPS